VRQGVDLPGYEVLGVLGVGGQAAVYRARQQSMAGREVAVKVYDRALLGERDRRRFSREVRASASLSGHRHVIQVYDSGLLPSGQPFLAMELCSGGSLSARLRERGPIPDVEVAAIGVKIASALSTAHGAGVQHRDVKPGNILVTRDGEPVLTDFGIAVVVTPGAEQSATLGLLTPAYAAPELFHGSQPTEASDIYSLGATLYALLIGRPVRWPPDREPSLAELFRIHNDPLPDLPGVAQPLTGVLRRCMAFNPAKRYASANEVAWALNEVWTAMRAGSGGLGRSRPPDTPPDGTPPRRGHQPIPEQPRAGRVEPVSDKTAQLPGPKDWRDRVDARRPVGVKPTTRELTGDMVVALSLVIGLGVWGFGTRGPAAGFALIGASLTMLALAAAGRLYAAIAAYAGTLAVALWAAAGRSGAQPIAWLITAIAIAFAGVVVYDVRKLRRNSKRALAQPLWHGRPSDRPLLGALAHIPSARFFRLPYPAVQFAVVAGDRIALLRWAAWPSRRYTVRGDRVHVGEHAFEPGSRELAGLADELRRQRELISTATVRAFLVVRGEAGHPPTIDAPVDADVTVLPEELAEPAIGEFLAERPYDLVAPLIDHLTTVVAKAAGTSTRD
jgi:serine/threonine protein kinase